MVKQGALVGLPEIAELLGVKLGTAQAYAGRDESFPKPATQAGERPARFNRAEVEQYIQERRARLGGAELLGYAEVAELLEVKIATVRIYAVEDERFPKPATAPGVRSPRFRRDDVEEYIKERNSRTGGRGRQPRTAVPDNSTPAQEYASLIRAAIASGGFTIKTQRALRERLGLDPTSFGFRMRGERPWMAEEVRAIKRLLNIAPTAGLGMRK